MILNTTIAQDAVGDLNVVISGIKKAEGKVKVALANSKESYENDEKVFRVAKLDINGNKATCVFEQIPFGEYAVKVFHDKNDDDKLDFNFLGMPTEDYGFSNNARGAFGPASYEDAMFLLQSKEKMIEINVH